jgi:hypothetical protein
MMNEEMRTVTSGSRSSRQHRGVNFAIWWSEGAWFWFLIDPRGEGGVIGASANEAQAMREACLSIEENCRFDHPNLLTANTRLVEDERRLGAC